MWGLKLEFFIGKKISILSDFIFYNVLLKRKKKNLEKNPKFSAIIITIIQ